MIALAHGDQAAAIEPRGAALRAWSVAGEEHVSYVDPERTTDGATLMPWPNRVRDGRFDGGTVDVDEPERGAALHGLVAGVEWAVADRSDDAVLLRHRIDTPPWTLDATVGYGLSDAGLTVELSAVNAGDAPVPFGCGSHPYLRGPVDDAHLDLPARSVVPTDDERLLPTGPPEPATPPRALAGVALDTCFGDLGRDADGLARVRVRLRERVIALWLDRAFPFLHVYTGDDEPVPARRRTRLALEPVTCAPDALNTGLGLLTLDPGRSFRGRWGLTQETA